MDSSRLELLEVCWHAPLLLDGTIQGLVPKDWSLRRRILTGYYFWILKAATWNHVQYWITYWILITELLQQIYFGILILFNSLTLVAILHFSTRSVKLVLQIDVHASCN